MAMSQDRNQENRFRPFLYHRFSVTLRKDSYVQTVKGIELDNIKYNLQMAQNKQNQIYLFFSPTEC